MATVQDTSSAAACSVTLTAFPADRKVSVIKAVRDLTGLGLKETKNLIETLPTTIAAELSAANAAAVKGGMERVGATVLIEPPPEELKLALPDSKVLDRRLHELQADVWNAQAVVQSVEWAIRETLDADNDPAHSLMRALRPAIELLDRIGSGLDSVVLFKAAEAQEASHV